jgi:UDP-N-acetylmuramate--alanine ligase
MYYAMKACGVNPTLIVGSLLADKGTNFIAGDSKYLIVEACEYRRSFLNLSPTHVVVTNIDEDHLDYYKDLNDITQAFQSFVDLIPVWGTLTTHKNVSLSTLSKIIDGGMFAEEGIELSVLGDHNKQNAQLVLSLLTSLHFDESLVRRGLQDFPGTWRRMEYKGKTLHGIPVYDDYGHHPREIQASVQALRTKYPRDAYHLTMLFQPHLYSRTKAFLNDFADVLATVDEVYILPIYKARLEDTVGINEDIVVDAINSRGGHAKKLATLSDIPACIESVDNPRAVIVNMGAGNAFEELHKVTLL